GANLLAIAYSKAAEMAETLKDSGNAGRPPMTGETGWQGGLIKRGKTGYLIAAFSGGPSESDLKVSQAGLEEVAGKVQGRRGERRSSETKCSALALTMNRKTKSLLAGLFLVLGFSTQAKDIEFGGYTWAVRSGRGGPGPNAWDQNNVWLDTSTNLHLI